MSRWTQRPKRAQQPKVPHFDPGTPLEPGEEIIFWGDAAFATGIAPPVQGRRWYRDPRGLDIEPLLEQAGWPHRDGPCGPPVPPRPDRGDKAAKAAETGFKVAQVAAGLLVSVGGGLNSAGGVDLGPAGKYMDPALESDDFPVMVAAPGSIASAAPWPLDPARRITGYEVLLTFTTSRLLFTGIAVPEGRWGPAQFLTELPRELLWQLPRQRVSGAEQRKYSPKEADVIVRFIDGSWLRLNLDSNGNVVKLVGSLAAS
jgi:hypothetical protein